MATHLNHEILDTIDTIVNNAAIQAADDGTHVSTIGMCQGIIEEYGLDLEPVDLAHMAIQHGGAIMEGLKQHLSEQAEADPDGDPTPLLVSAVQDVAISTYIRGFLSGMLAQNLTHNRSKKNTIGSRMASRPSRSRRAR